MLSDFILMRRDAKRKSYNVAVERMSARSMEEVKMLQKAPCHSLVSRWGNEAGKKSKAKWLREVKQFLLLSNKRLH